MQHPSPARFYLINFGIPLLLVVAVFCAFDLTNLDIAFSNLFYGPVAHVFPLDSSQAVEYFTHKLPRIIPDWTGQLAIIGTLLSFLWPRLKHDKHAAVIAVLQRLWIAPVLKFCARHRRDLLFVVVAFAVSTGVTHFFKSHTGIYCPIETTLYGGKHPKLEWFQNLSLLHDAGTGRCWPGGHASGGFTVCALYFVARRYRWRHARRLLAGILLLGFVYGTTRVFQGWHYMSHTFWAGIFVWLATLLTALAFYGRKELDQPDIARPPAVSHEPNVT